MIVRGCLVNPVLVKELNDYFECKKINKEYCKKEISNGEKIALLRYHFQELLKLKGEKIAVLEMRTLAGWYVKGMKNTKEFRIALTTVKTSEELINLIDKLEK